LHREAKKKFLGRCRECECLIFAECFTLANSEAEEEGQS
jgi:hypothetical protein